jgi:histidinol-phosphatase (PHP family)
VLRFEGVDCFAGVLLNGKLLGRTDSMLTPSVFDATGALRPAGESNELVVCIQPAVRVAALATYDPNTHALPSNFESLRVRKAGRSVTLSDRPPEASPGELVCLCSHHTDTPGTLSILLNTLASEEINVETAYLNSLHDGTATAYLPLTGSPEGIREAVDFVRGTAPERFFSIEPEVRIALPPFKSAPAYLLEVDGVELPVPLSRQMIVSVHANRPGVLLILLSALAARNVNVLDMQLGRRGNRGYAVLGVSGDPQDVEASLANLGPEFAEVSSLRLSRLELLTSSSVA